MTKRTRRTPPILLIEQEPLAPAGHLRDWLDQREIPYEVVTPSSGEEVPDVSRFAGVIALGSTKSAYDDHVPWVAQELDQLRRAVDGGTPVLGICFGAQALARSLGATVAPASRTEIGWVQVGGQDGGPIADGPWFTWHSDVFELPDGATLLARNGHSIQAFAHGPHLGVQFHPEVTPEIIERWLELAEREGVIADGDADRRRISADYEQARANAFALFDAWYERVRPRGGQPVSNAARRE